MPPQSPQADPVELARSLEKFLAEHPRAALLDGGEVLFDLSAASYALSAEHGRCVLHLWSEERNLVRTVIGLEERKDKLCILVRRLGAKKTHSLYLVPDRDRRTPASRELARKGYLRLLERVLLRAFADDTVQGLRSAMDLENSFGPAYARGLLVRGQRAWAVIGAGAAETQATLDGILTLGILWLAHCRQHPGRTVCQGLRVIVPRGNADVTRARMAWLHPGLGAWELYELSEDTEELARVDISRDGNLEMRMVQAFDAEAARARAQSGLDRLLALLSEGMRQQVVLHAKSPNEIALTLHGLEFARVRHGFTLNSFTREDRVTFGAGANETVLTPETEAWFADLAKRLFEHRYPEGNARNPLFRLRPEGWLESTLRKELGELEPTLLSHVIYSQVPAFAAADRAVLDLLTATQSGRLAVLELKASEDLHLPLQGLDYWIRVRRLHERAEENAQSELQRCGYFPGLALSGEDPLLYFVAPALWVHPSMEMVLAHFSPAIPWTLIALNEGWRARPAVVFRKRAPPASVRAGAAPARLEEI